ncbi:MAG: nascent polypeptide-associated complex protein [Nanohaloarchaea archaeon SW_7_46_7]|nr:MAG: nascent polypeptide-associated complex protein [Nanohaloarchaea archaeon SW_7_46_7]
MFGGNMQQMMKQMGVDMEQINADKVEVHVGDKKMVFNSPEISKIDAQGQEMFQLQGNYTEEQKDTGPEEDDIELVMEKTEASREEAEQALENSDDVAEAVMELS